MATYNGAPYVEDQISSILSELGAQDEVVVVDDASSDHTLDRVRGIGDPRIRVLTSERNRGHVRSFERAIRASRGEVIMLADQDDLWIPGRVELMVDGLRNAEMVAGNLRVFGIREGMFPLRLCSQDSFKRARNVVGIFLGTRPYFGCAMAFRRDLLPVLLPVPPYIESHDLWFALVAARRGSLRHLDAPTVLRREHGTNLTPERRRSLRRVVVTRVRLTRGLLEASRRSRRVGPTRRPHRRSSATEP